MKRKAIVAAALVVAMSATLITGCGKSKEAAFPDPEKTITLIVPQGAGGGTDTQARQLVEAMKEVSGNNNIIVENVTGGSTGTGTNQVIDSEADGYTLLMYGTYVICGTMTGYTDGFKELDILQTVRTRGGTEFTTTRCPITIDGEHYKSEKPAPRIGQDNRIYLEN